MRFFRISQSVPDLRYEEIADLEMLFMLEVPLYACYYVPSSSVFMQVHCSIPASVAEQERKLIEEAVAAECCPETIRRIRETGAQVVSKTHRNFYYDILLV